MINEIKFTFKNDIFSPISIQMMDDGKTKDPYKFIFGNDFFSQTIVHDLISKIKLIFDGDPINLVEMFKDVSLDRVYISFLEGKNKYLYSFGLDDEYSRIDEESLKMISPSETSIVYRKNNKIEENIFGNYFKNEEKRRLLLYAYDLKYDNKKLLIPHLSNRYIDINEKITVFDYVKECFESLKVESNNILKVGKFTNEGFNYAINLLINSDLINSTHFELVEIDLLSFRMRIGRFLYDYLLTETTVYYDRTRDNSFIVNINNEIYIINYFGNDFIVNQIKLTSYDKLINDFSSTLVNLLFKLTNILSTLKASNFFYENIFENIEVRKVNDLITKLKPLLEERVHKLTTTTNNVYILDLKILNKNEIAFINKVNNKISLTNLKAYNLRNDKVLTKGYFEGVFD